MVNITRSENDIVSQVEASLKLSKASFQLLAEHSASNINDRDVESALKGLRSLRLITKDNMKAAVLSLLIYPLSLSLALQEANCHMNCRLSIVRYSCALSLCRHCDVESFYRRKAEQATTAWSSEPLSLLDESKDDEENRFELSRSRDICSLKDAVSC